jgi:hypothetical protein
MKKSFYFIIASLGFFAGCEQSTCVESYPETLESVWASGSEDISKEIRQRRLALLPNDKTGGHYKLRTGASKSCKGSTFSIAQVDDLYEKAEVATNNACQVTYQLKNGRFVKALTYREIIMRTGIALDDEGTWSQPAVSSNVYLEVDAYESCEDLTRALNLALGGQVLSAIQGPLPPIRVQGPVPPPL